MSQELFLDLLAKSPPSGLTPDEDDRIREISKRFKCAQRKGMMVYFVFGINDRFECAPSYESYAHMSCVLLGECIQGKPIVRRLTNILMSFSNYVM